MRLDVAFFSLQILTSIHLTRYFYFFTTTEIWTHCFDELFITYKKLTRIWRDFFLQTKTNFSPCLFLRPIYPGHQFPNATRVCKSPSSRRAERPQKKLIMWTNIKNKWNLFLHETPEPVNRFCTNIKNFQIVWSALNRQSLFSKGCADYIAPSLLSIWSFCLFIFFLDTFFFSGSLAAVLEKACSFSTRTTSMWQGEDM